MVHSLREWWERQQVPEDWKETVRAQVLMREEARWREQVLRNGKLQIYAVVKEDMGLEAYLQCPDVARRRLWGKLRAGALEIRVETGRWERVSVGGRQVEVPHALRECELCYAEVEDERHFLFRCPSYEGQRVSFLREARQLRMGERVSAAAAEMERGGSVGEAEEGEVLKWMMTDGLEASMKFVTDIWTWRKELRKQFGLDGDGEG